MIEWVDACSECSSVVAEGEQEMSKLERGRSQREKSEADLTLSSFVLTVIKRTRDYTPGLSGSRERMKSEVAPISPSLSLSLLSFLSLFSSLWTLF